VNHPRETATPQAVPRRAAAPGALDPERWDAGEVRRALLLGAAGHDPRPATATGSRGMLVGSTGPFAHLAGAHALAAGGSAVDAVITTALTQIALAAGSWVSYAGLFSLLHIDGDTGQVSALSAGFGTLAGETDPGGIPPAPIPSGRSALVPGFVAGAHAAHQRFGRLPWAQLWTPSRHVAERGLPVGEHLAGMFASRAGVLTRTPEGRAVFAPDGRLPAAGDTFRQPALARSLGALAEHGPDWMYRGPWAERCTELVARDGGRARLADLAAYRPTWLRPAHGQFAGHDVSTLPAPDTGGIALLTALGLAEAADLGDPTADADALYWLIQIVRQSASGRARDTGDADIRTLWQRMRAAGAALPHHPVPPGSHSDYVIAADPQGNLAAVCHSANTAIWGTTGIVVQGIPLPDPAAFQQPLLATLAPGAHLPMPVNPAIATRPGGPVLACSSIGTGLHPVTVQCLHAALRLGLDPATVVGRPLVHDADFVLGDSVTSAVALAADTPSAQAVDDRFAPELLDRVRRRGQPVTPRTVTDPTLPRGFWGAVTRSPTGELFGARTPYGQGPVRAH
jgi:gamma-glutamyltranspeptidase / glutathione hydrolase